MDLGKGAPPGCGRKVSRRGRGTARRRNAAIDPFPGLRRDRFLSL